MHTFVENVFSCEACAGWTSTLLLLVMFTCFNCINRTNLSNIYLLGVVLLTLETSRVPFLQAWIVYLIFYCKE
jgi:hypothetical protein